MSAQITPESKIDVLIIGAGPAGLTAAAWMAHLGIKTRIVDKRSDKVQLGQADGVHARTQEVFDSFGFGDRTAKEGNPCVETHFWVPDGNKGIKKMGGGPFDVPGLSKFKLCTLMQGKIESFYIDNIKKYSATQIERGVIPESLEIDEKEVENRNAYPLTIKLRHLTTTEARVSQSSAGALDNGVLRSNIVEDDTEDILEKSRGRADAAELVKAKYVIGCDGAHSWTRQQIASRLEGDSTDYIFGVVDIVPISDFPDIRIATTIHSEEHGLMYVIPRERKVVRFYVQLEEVELNEHGRIDRSQVTPQAIVNAAQKILAPYELSYKRCEWFTAYQIGRRVGDSYGKFNRVFLAGDAVHTHSPRGGQGMNLSIQDTYNLGWKIGLCVKNTAPRSILQTYESERRQVAKDLIDLDRLAGDPITGKRVSRDEFIENIDPVRLGMLSAAFYSGFTVNYDKSILVFKDTEERKGVAWTKDVTNKIVIGMRFPGLQIIRQADASVWSFLHWLKSDGRFRIILFAGNIKEAGQKERIETFCDNLEKEGSFLKRVTPPTARIDSVIEILTLHSSPRAQTDIFDFPSLLRPFDAEKGWDYDKIFVDDETYHYGHGQAYKNYGIDRCSGAAVVVRPDQHVAHVGDIDDIATLERYFAGVLLDAPQGLST